MDVVSVAVPAGGFSAVLSLLSLNPAAIEGCSFSKTLTSSDVFRIWGTLDAGAVDATNATDLGQVSGGDGSLLPLALVQRGGDGSVLAPSLTQRALNWPYVLLERVSGTGVGNLEVAGNFGASPPVVATALPAVGAFSALLDLTAFESRVRIGTSALETAGDEFDVYVTNDATTVPGITGVAGAWLIGRISGGGSPSGQGLSGVTSLVVSGFAYAFVRRFSGGTPGSLLAAGAAVPATAGTSWLIGGNVLAPGTYLLGTLTVGAILSVVAEGVEVARSDGATTAFGSALGAASTRLQSGTGPLALESQGVINVGVNAVAQVITIGNGIGATSVTVDCGTGGASFGANATAHPTTIGSAFGASSALLQSGTGPLALESQGNISVGANPVAQVITIGNAAGATSVAINAGTGGCSLGANAVAMAIVIGNATGNTSVQINAGTGGCSLGANAVAMAIVIGNATGNTSVQINAGTGGCSLGANAVAMTIEIGNAVGATLVNVNCGTGGCSFGANATDHSTTIGSIVGASPTAIRAGTGGLTIANNGVSWRWPTADGIAGTKLTTDGAGGLSFT
jgi:hypothetical protein